MIYYLFVFRILHIINECYVQKCAVCMCEAVHSMKKIVAGLSYPKPLCFLVKAALAYIAAGSYGSCGVHLIIFIRLLMLLHPSRAHINTP